MRRLAVILLGLSWALVAGGAQAQVGGAGGAPATGEGPTQAPPSPDDGVGYPPGSRDWSRPPSWGEGRQRSFVAGSFDLGFLYIRPRFQFGYGKPHNQWFGLDLNPTVTPRVVGGYTGLRIDYPFVDWRGGVRFGYPLRRSYMLEKPNSETFDRGDLNREVEGESGSYLSLESELTMTVPIGDGNLFSETALTYVTGVPDGSFVYEDTIKVIVDPPWVWRERIGYMAQFGETGAVRVGFVGEVVGVPARDMIVVRAGLILRVWVNPRVEVRGAWIPALYARDSLGVRGGDFGLLGVRYRWSTGGVTGAQEGPPAVLPELRDDEEAPVN